MIGSRGLKGEVLIKSFTAQPENIGVYGQVFDNVDRYFDIKVIGKKNKLVIACLSGVLNREDADALKGVSLYVLKKMLPIEAVLDDIPALALNEIEARKLKLGQKIQFNSLEFKNKFLNKHPNFLEFEKICAIRNNTIIALVKIETDLVKPKRIINIKIEGKYDVDRKE